MVGDWTGRERTRRQRAWYSERGPVGARTLRPLAFPDATLGDGGRFCTGAEVGSVKC